MASCSFSAAYGEPAQSLLVVPFALPKNLSAGRWTSPAFDARGSVTPAQNQMIRSSIQFEVGLGSRKAGHQSFQQEVQAACRGSVSRLRHDLVSAAFDEVLKVLRIG